ncbi:MAG: SRPBCC family protein [Bacteroidales bacterium]|jgi:hypothetical protein|nr:SRPBCC family protein [Bacteroidales bacterium]
MEVKIESKVGELNQMVKCVYSFLSDCENFRPLAVSEKIKDWQSDCDSCSFSVDGVGRLVFRIVERVQEELVKFTIENPQAENVFLWVQLKNVSLNGTRIKLTAKLDINPMFKLLISKPLKQALDKIVETLENLYKS